MDSLSSASPFKEGIFTPYTRQVDKDKESLSSYRPDNNLTWKLLDRIAQEQLADHLNETDKWRAMQSAYRPNQSTETAMIWPSNLVLSNVSISISMIIP